MLVEDPLAEDDWASWSALLEKVVGVEIVDHNLTVTNVERMKEVVGRDAYEGSLLRIKQIETSTGTIAA